MRRALTGLALGLALGACNTAPPRVGEAPPQATDPDSQKAYQDVFDRWTRHAEVYSALDTRMFLAATAQSPEFVRARVTRFAQFQGMPSADATALLTRELADASQGYEFFLGVHTNERRVNDLDRASSIWRVALSTPAGEVTPISIERISRLDVNLRGIYLYLGDFWIGYRVRFPILRPDGKPVIAPGDATVSLKLDSALGHAQLDFPAQAMALVAPPPTPVLAPASAPVPTPVPAPEPVPAGQP